MKKEAEANAVEDAKKKEEVEKLNEADSMIFQTEKQIKEYDEKLDENSKEQLTEIVSRLKKAKEDKNLNSIDSIMEEINKKWQEVSTQLYENSESENVNETTDSENTTDVEFEEVK